MLVMFVCSVVHFIICSLTFFDLDSFLWSYIVFIEVDIPFLFDCYVAFFIAALFILY